MMTRATFVRLSKRFVRRGLGVAFAALALFVAFTMVFWLAPDWFTSGPPFRKARVLALVLGVPVGMGVVIVIVLLAATRGLRRQLACPHCGVSLFGEHRTGIVVATGNCPACGERVLESGPASADDDEQLDAAP
jgi:DNA-directed RNA polymerase subunit RPC12/RpoP